MLEQLKPSLLQEDPLPLFPEFPQALHLASKKQCQQYNRDLMSKIVSERTRKNRHFKESAIMSLGFKYARETNEQMCSGS